MTLILVNSQSDNKSFNDVFVDEFKDTGTTILVNPSAAKAKAAIKNEHELVLFCGHGTRYGLFNHESNGYLIDSSNVSLLKNKEVVGIWCYASEFADTYGLHGFFTSMFISNEVEAACNSIIADNKDIEFENTWFANQISYLIKDHVPMDEWVQYLQMNCNVKHEFVRFNYEALAYLK